MTKLPHILVVEDDREISALVARYLRSNDCRVTVAGNGRDVDRVTQQLRAEKLIADSERVVEFLDAGAMQTLAHYQPQALAPIPPPAKMASPGRFLLCAARIDTPIPVPTLALFRGVPR